MHPCFETKTLVSCLFAICLITFAFPVEPLAKEEEQSTLESKQLEELPVEDVGNRAYSLIKQINAIITEGNNYVRLLNDVSQEDRLVVELHLFVLQDRTFDRTQQLADALLVLEKSAPHPALRSQVEAIYSDMTPKFWATINRLRSRIDKARDRRHDADLNDRYTIESEVSRFTERVDELIEMGRRHVRKMGEIGIDNQPALEELTKHVSARAKELSGRITLALARVEEMEDRVNKKIPGDTESTALLIILKKNLTTNTTSMFNTLNIMKKIGIGTDAYRTQLAMATRDFSSSLLDTAAAVNLLRRVGNSIVMWFVDSGPTLLLQVGTFFGILIFFRFVTRLVRIGVERILDASDLNLSRLGRQMIVSWVSKLVMIFGIILALSQIGIKLGPLLTGLGVAGFIVGFALQDTLSNFASGVMILIYRPYDMGDTVDVGGVHGQVDKMSLVSTTILTFDNQTIVVPNNKIWGDVIKNVTAQTIRRVDMVFGISYSDDIPEAEKMFMDILMEHDKVLDDPQPVVRLHTLEASSVDFIVRPWVNVRDYWDVYWDVTRKVKLRFDEAGVSIPFPQRDVHVYYENKPAPDGP